MSLHWNNVKFLSFASNKIEATNFTCSMKFIFYASVFTSGIYLQSDLLNVHSWYCYILKCHQEHQTCRSSIQKIYTCIDIFAYFLNLFIYFCSYTITGLQRNSIYKISAYPSSSTSTLMSFYSLSSKSKCTFNCQSNSVFFPFQKLNFDTVSDVQ